MEDLVYDVDDDTPVEVVIAILETACNALNHDDEDYIPAIRYAINVLKHGHPTA